tara:strand:- start:715 stop:909 length:195 start_codon:yes stop_codon:yes gene_type:complete
LKSFLKYLFEQRIYDLAIATLEKTLKSVYFEFQPISDIFFYFFLFNYFFFIKDAEILTGFDEKN